MDNYIEITGITSSTAFPRICCGYPNNEIIETDTLCVPKRKPPIEDIIQVHVHIKVCSYKIICTPVGKKLIIEGYKHIRVIYVADEPCQPVHSAHFNVPFCMFVLLKDCYYPVEDVFTAVEDVIIHQIDCRCFSVSIVIFACPVFKSKYDTPYKYGCHKQSHYSNSEQKECGNRKNIKKDCSHEPCKDYSYECCDKKCEPDYTVEGFCYSNIAECDNSVEADIT